jgi:hypothetical protein
MSDSMHQELFTTALGLQAPWSVTSFDFDQQAGRIDFHVGFSRGSHFDFRQRSLVLVVTAHRRT